ncbi:unnamed protein product [Chondrus crispus]|uniref:Uncharacterized protein n=1 Tax=Chondrus crispus TaxID=2769 RepID=R7Q4G9_CHOCR|nr:unnamed protein product [Chondrus crispus]CDF32360.1 unnamed protein product [Chondrus crispus]|eukprot:XP_005712025.1 unnamed protein product [Chondrus crispus]
MCEGILSPVAEISASHAHFSLAVECPGWHSHSSWPNRRSQRRRPIPSDTKYLSTKQHISCRFPPPRLYSCKASSHTLFVSRLLPGTTTPLPTRTVTLVRPPSQTNSFHTSYYPTTEILPAASSHYELALVCPPLGDPPASPTLAPTSLSFPFTPALFTTHRRSQENYCRPLRVQRHGSALNAALRAPERQALLLPCFCQPQPPLRHDRRGPPRPAPPRQAQSVFRLRDLTSGHSPHAGSRFSLPASHPEPPRDDSWLQSRNSRSLHPNARLNARLSHLS